MICCYSNRLQEWSTSGYTDPENNNDIQCETMYAARGFKITSDVTIYFSVKTMSSYPIGNILSCGFSMNWANSTYGNPKAKNPTITQLSTNPFSLLFDRGSYDSTGAVKTWKIVVPKETFYYLPNYNTKNIYYIGPWFHMDSRTFCDYYSIVMMGSYSF